MSESYLRRLEFEKLVLPPEIGALGRPDAVFGLHPAREKWLWSLGAVSGLAGFLAAVWIFATRAQTPFHPAVLLGALLVGGGTSLAFCSRALHLKGRILLVYLDCLVLMDYEHSRVVAVAEERPLRSFHAPGLDGYRALVQELSALSLVETEVSPSEAVERAVGAGRHGGGQRSLNSQGRAGIALMGIGLALLLMALLQDGTPASGHDPSLVPDLPVAAAQPTLAPPLTPDPSLTASASPNLAPGADAGPQLAASTSENAGPTNPASPLPVVAPDAAAPEQTPSEKVAPETVGTEKIAPEPVDQSAPPMEGGTRAGN